MRAPARRVSPLSIPSGLAAVVVLALCGVGGAPILGCGSTIPVDPADTAALDASGLDSATRADLDASPSADTSPSDASPRPPPPLPWTDDPCATLDLGTDPFADVVRSYGQKDDLAPPPQGGLVVVGSSTIRRWRSAARVLSLYDPIQRGVGGARMADIAAHADVLVLRHAPAGVLLFAGTNDLADGRTARSVIDAYRCFATKLHASRPGVPLLYIGITPTPARWSRWSEAVAVNTEIARLATLHPSLRYVDSPAPFLAAAGSGGGPPPARLFEADGLHQSPEGYALFESVVVPSVTAALPVATRGLPAAPPKGTLVRVDMGPSNALDGAPAPSTDGFGIRWNNWHPMDGSSQVHAGEALRRLRGTRGESTEVTFFITGGFRANGLRNGGLVSPSSARLGTLAVPEATEDYFYSGDPDDPAGFALEGLSATQQYTLRLFASRSAPDERRTAFTAWGTGPSRTASVQTSGPNLGANGGTANDSEVTVLAGLTPDARGRIFVDVDRMLGPFSYVSLLELQADGP